MTYSYQGIPFRMDMLGLSWKTWCCCPSYFSESYSMWIFPRPPLFNLFYFTIYPMYIKVLAHIMSAWITRMKIISLRTLICWPILFNVLVFLTIFFGQALFFLFAPLCILFHPSCLHSPSPFLSFQIFWAYPISLLYFSICSSPFSRVLSSFIVLC